MQDRRSRIHRRDPTPHQRRLFHWHFDPCSSEAHFLVSLFPKVRKDPFLCYKHREKPVCLLLDAVRDRRVSLERHHGAGPPA